MGRNEPSEPVDADANPEDNQTENAPDKRKWRLIALAVFLVGIGIAAALYFLRPQAEGTEPPDRPPLVSVEPVRRKAEPIVITGRGEVQSSNELGLSLQVSGRVVYVNPNLREGRKVRKGETLVRVEPEDFANRVTAARSSVERARVNLQQAIETRETRREEFRRLRERLQEPTNNSDPDALEADFIRPDEDSAQIDGESAATIEASPLALGEPQVEAARAELEGAEARLRNARLNARRTSITAPFDAIVRSETVERGQFVRAGEPIAQIYNSDAAEIVVPLTQKRVALIPGLFKPARAGGTGGAPATVKIDFGGATYAWDARVDGARGALNSQTRTLDVIVKVARPTTGGSLVDGSDAASGAPPLLPGFFATVEFLAQTPIAYFTIPADALRSEDRIWVVRDERIVFLAAQIIARDDNAVFITADGLQDNDLVVTGDIASVSEGIKVRTSRETNAPAVEAQQTGGNQPRYKDAAE